MSDYFRPPSAPVGDAARPPGSALKGFIVGLLVDIGGTLVFGIVLTFGYALVMSGQGMSEKQIEDALMKADSQSWLFVAGLIGGTFLSLLGGYVCERIARRGNYRLGLGLGAASTAVGLMMGGYTHALFMNVLLAMATIVAVLIGTHIAFGRRRV